MKRPLKTLTFSAAIGAGLLAATAYAQQPAASPPPAPTQSQAAPQPDAPAPRGPRGMTNEDRAAFFDARVAAVHAGLKLTPDQERLWPPLEGAVRDMARQMTEMRDQRRSQAAPADPVEGMARMGDAAMKRGQALTRLAEAARPLYASLTDDQKRRLRVLMRHPGADRDGRGMMGRDGGRERHGWRHDRMGHAGRGDHDAMRGMGDDDMRPGRRSDDSRGGRWNEWR